VAWQTAKECAGYARRPCGDGLTLLATRINDRPFGDILLVKVGPWEFNKNGAPSCYHNMTCIGVTALLDMITIDLLT
jgi:hypothetical protein